MSKILQGDALNVLKTIESSSIQTCITSPPYFGLRDYGHKNQIGLEETPDAYVLKLVELFREVKRILKDDGTLWLNLGDSYGKEKQLIGIPWRVAFALQADGWVLRQDIIWAKPNSMPESVTDRCTKSHEYIFLLSKSPKYYFDNEAIKEIATGYDGRKDTMYHGGAKDMAGGKHERWKKRKNADTNYGGNGSGLHNHSGYSNLVNPYVRNKRSIWTIPTKPYNGAHFATFPEALIEPMVLAGSAGGGIVLDPFMGAGTTAVVAKKLGRQYLGIELNPAYVKLAEERIAGTSTPLF